MLDFPVLDLIPEDLCYQKLVDTLHPRGLCCPNGHPLPTDQAPPDRYRPPVVRYKCRPCKRVFTAFPGTPLARTHDTCVQLVLILRGFLRGDSTKSLAEQLSLSRSTLLDFRHRVQGATLERVSPLGVVARPTRRSRRDVPERGRERHPPR